MQILIISNIISYIIIGILLYKLFKNKVSIKDYLKHEHELHRRIDETHTRISDIQQELLEEIKSIIN